MKGSIWILIIPIVLLILTIVTEEKIFGFGLFAYMFIVAIAALLYEFSVSLWRNSSWSTSDMDRKAEAILQDKFKTFNLLLRSFEMDAVISILPNDARAPEDVDKDKTPYWERHAENAIDERQPIELFDAITAGVETKAALLAVGDRDFKKRTGPGLLSIGDEPWQKLVCKLIKRSEKVFIMPWPSKGTLWEIKYLIENDYLGKTLFIMPPSYGIDTQKRMASSSGMDNAYDGVFFYKIASTRLPDEHPGLAVFKGYNEAANILLDMGIELPKYDESGKIFFLSSGKWHQYSLPYSTDEMREILSAHNKIENE